VFTVNHPAEQKIVHTALSLTAVAAVGTFTYAGADILAQAPTIKQTSFQQWHNRTFGDGFWFETGADKAAFYQLHYSYPDLDMKKLCIKPNGQCDTVKLNEVMFKKTGRLLVDFGADSVIPESKAQVKTYAYSNLVAFKNWLSSPFK